MSASSNNCVLIHQDHYFTQRFKNYADRTDDSFEGPAHLDFKQLYSDVRWAQSQHPIVVVEGHLIGTYIPLYQSADLIITLSKSQAVCKRQRLNRKERTTEEYQQLEDYFDMFVWPGYVKYGMDQMEILATYCAQHQIGYININDEDKLSVSDIAEIAMKILT